MKALLRILVLWLLMAGVPLQGYASATMLLCAPPATAAAHSAAMAHGEHDHAAMLAAQEHGDHQNQQDNQNQPGTHHGDAKCAGAAFCCTGAPLAGAMPTAPSLPDARSAPVPFDSTAPAAVDLAGLERPPKHLA
ncbi:hypothetical protein GCM10007388_23690 [Pseudoduganella plicata]|nr:hypothetical protein GCM10007388_23690 [Pseudoduganella plicata]